MLVIDEINDYVSEIVYTIGYITGLHDDIDGTRLLAHEAEKIRANSADQKRELDAYRGELVQLASAYSYTVCQAFAGVPPIRDSRGVAHRYSLLGLGTAVRGLAALFDMMEGAYGGAPVETALSAIEAAVDDDGEPLARFSWDDIDAIKLDLPASFKHPVDSGSEPTSRLEWAAVTDGPRRSGPKMIYFSGRLGFKESSRSIAAAIQSLYGAAAKRWSLLTFSHEYIHHEVELLWTYLWSSTETQDAAARLAAAYAKSERRRSGEEKIDFSISDVIRTSILLYCIREQNILIHGVTDGDKVHQDQAWALNKKNINKLIRKSKPFINEIIVHTIDFLDTYNSNIASFIFNLWEGWDLVPIVEIKVDQYVVRTLSSISVAVLAGRPGNPREHYDAACDTLLDHLTELRKLRNSGNGEDGGAGAIDSAIELLKRKPEGLWQLYKPTLLIARVTETFLRTGRARRLHRSDSNAEFVGERADWVIGDPTVNYAAEPLTFQPLTLESPMAFLRMMFDSHSADLGIEADEATSVWVFSVLCLWNSSHAEATDD